MNNIPNIEQTNFIGMNQDKASRDLPSGWYYDAMNIRSASPLSGQKGRLETFNGYDRTKLFTDGTVMPDSNYILVGGFNDEDSNHIYLFYFNHLPDAPEDQQHLILRYEEQTDTLRQIIKSKNLFTTSLDDCKILNHCGILNGYLAWTEGKGQPKMFNVNDALSEVGPFANPDKNKIPAEVFMLPYYTPLQEPYIDRYTSGNDGERFAGFGSIKEYKNISLENGHQFAYQFVHYNGMPSCLSAISQIYFTNNFNVCVQLDDMRQLYNINEFIPDTRDGDNAIVLGALEEETDSVTTIGQVKFIRWLARLGNTGSWQLIEEKLLPQTVASSTVTQIARLEYMDTMPNPFWLQVGNREDLKGTPLPTDDQNYIFSAIPYNARDLVFADSRLLLANFEDGYEIPTGLSYDFTKVKTSTIAADTPHNFETAEDVQRVIQKFKDGDVREFGLVFYDKYRRRSTVGYTRQEYIYPSMYEPVATADYDAQDPPLGFEPYKLFLTQSGTFTKDDVPVKPWYAWLNDERPVFDLFQLASTNGELPDWVEYVQVVTRDSNKYNSFIQTMARPQFWVYNIEEGDVLSGAKTYSRTFAAYTFGGDGYGISVNADLGVLNLEGIAFVLSNNEPYVYEKGDIIRVQMSQAILDKDNIYDTQVTGEYYATFGFYDFPVKEVRGNVVFCTFPDDLYQYINSLDNKTKTTLAGKPDIVLMPPFYAEFRRRWQSGVYDDNVGHINSMMDEVNTEYVDGPNVYISPRPQAGFFSSFLPAVPFGQVNPIYRNTQFWKIDILKPNRSSNGLWYECGPAVNAKKYWGVNRNDWRAFDLDIWGDTYMRSFTYQHTFTDVTLKTIKYKYEASPDAYQPEYSPQKLLGWYFCTHHETTTPVTLYGQNFNNAGKGQPNTLTVIDQAIRYPTGVTFSGILREGGLFNELNRFAFDSLFQYPKEIGPICKMANTSNLESVGVGLLILGETYTVSAMVRQVQFKDTGSGDVVAISDQVLGSYQILQENFGCSHELTVYGKNGWVIFFDSKRMELVRYNRNGLTPLGQTFGMKKWLTDQVKYWQDKGQTDGLWFGGYDNQRLEYWLGFDKLNEITDNIVFLVFRDEDRREGFVSFIEGQTVVAEIEQNDGYVNARMMFSTENKLFGYYRQNEDLFYDNFYTGLLNLQTGQAIETNSETLLTILPSYITTVFNTSRKVRWSGITMQLNTNQGQRSIIEDVIGTSIPYDVLLECPDEIIVLNATSTLPLASRIKGKPVNWNYRDGRVSAAIKQALISNTGGNVTVDYTTGGGQDPRTMRIVQILANCLRAKITLIPARDPNLTEVQEPYYQRYLIFVQTKITDDTNQT